MGNGGAVLPEQLDWLAVYGLLGLEADLAPALKQLRPGKLARLWSMPVLPGIDTLGLSRAFKQCGLSLRTGQFGIAGDGVRHSRWPRTNPYLVYLGQNDRPDPRYFGWSTLRLEANGVKGANLIEYCLFSLAFLKTTGRHLDTETRTLASGTSADGHLFPSAGYDPEEEVVEVVWVDVTVADPRLGVRQVSMRP